MFGLHCTQFKEYFHRLADTPLSLFEEIDPFHAFYAFSFKSFFHRARIDFGSKCPTQTPCRRKIISNSNLFINWQVFTFRECSFKFNKPKKTFFSGLIKGTKCFRDWLEQFIICLNWKILRQLSFPDFWFKTFSRISEKWRFC